MFIQLENNDGTFDDLLAQETSDGRFILLEDAYIVSDQVEIRIPFADILGGKPELTAKKDLDHILPDCATT